MKAFTESGVLFPDDWELQPPEPPAKPVAKPAEPAEVEKPVPAVEPAPTCSETQAATSPATACLKRADLVELLCADYGMDRQTSRAFVAKFFDLIIEHLERGHQVKLAGFGKFHVRQKRARPGRNLKTGTPVMIDERRVVNYLSSATLNKRVSEAQGDKTEE